MGTASPELIVKPAFLDLASAACAATCRERLRAIVCAQLADAAMVAEPDEGRSLAASNGGPLQASQSSSRSSGLLACTSCEGQSGLQCRLVRRSTLLTSI